MIGPATSAFLASTKSRCGSKPAITVAATLPESDLQAVAGAHPLVTTNRLSTKAFSWNARANGTWTFDKKFDAQLYSNYRAPTKTEGGSSLANVNLGMALRYKRWGDQGSISLRVADPFKMTRFGYKTNNGQIVELQRNYFNSQAVFLGLNRSFGQAIRLKAKTESDDAGGLVPPSE
jgi:hypothetical protein